MISVLLGNLEFKIELYLVKQIPENIDRVVSGLILTGVLLQNLEFKVELYLVKQIYKNTDRVLSGLILTKLLLRKLQFEIELFLIKQIPENIKGYTRIGTDLKLFSGVGHLLHLHSAAPIPPL